MYKQLKLSIPSNFFDSLSVMLTLHTAREMLKMSQNETLSKWQLLTFAKVLVSSLQLLLFHF